MSELLLPSAQGLGGLVALLLGADWLVRGACALALRLGLSALAVGLTVVAFGTSAPELVVSLRAALAGAGDIALGNVVGSNICNIALILGLSALIRPARVNAGIFRLEAPLLVLSSLALPALLRGGGLGAAEGSLMLAGLAGFTGVTLWRARREAQEVKTEFRGGVEAPRSGLAGSVALVVAGLGLLLLGAELLVGAAIAAATALGVSEALIGLTIVALGTSLPELATSAVAAARGQGDIAIGNVVGSNLFNLLGILGVTALVRPLPPGGITALDLGVMIGLAVLLLPIARTGFVVSRAEGAGLLAIYAGYMAWLVAG